MNFRNTNKTDILYCSLNTNRDILREKLLPDPALNHRPLAFTASMLMITLSWPSQDKTTIFLCLDP